MKRVLNSILACILVLQPMSPTVTALTVPGTEWTEQAGVDTEVPANLNANSIEDLVGPRKEETEVPIDNDTVEDKEQPPEEGDVNAVEDAEDVDSEIGEEADEKDYAFKEGDDLEDYIWEDGYLVVDPDGDIVDMERMPADARNSTLGPLNVSSPLPHTRYNFHSFGWETSTNDSWQSMVGDESGMPMLTLGSSSRPLAVFCIEPNVAPVIGSFYERKDLRPATEPPIINGGRIQYSEEQVEMIRRILAYGYGTEYIEDASQRTSDDAYIVTQALIWEVIAETPRFLDENGVATSEAMREWDRDLNDITGTPWEDRSAMYKAFVDNNASRSYDDQGTTVTIPETPEAVRNNRIALYNEIKTNVIRHDILPSFMQPTVVPREHHEMTWYEDLGVWRITLTDTNGVLHRFFPGTSRQVDHFGWGTMLYERSGNTLTATLTPVNLAPSRGVDNSFNTTWNQPFSGMQVSTATSIDSQPSHSVVGRTAIANAAGLGLRTTSRHVQAHHRLEGTNTLLAHNDIPGMWIDGASATSHARTNLTPFIGWDRLPVVPTPETQTVTTTVDGDTVITHYYRMIPQTVTVEHVIEGTDIPLIDPHELEGGPWHLGETVRSDPRQDLTYSVNSFTFAAVPVAGRQTHTLSGDLTITHEYEIQRTQRTVRVEHRCEFTGELVDTLNGQPNVEYLEGNWYDGDQITLEDAPIRTFTSEVRPWSPTTNNWMHNSRYPSNEPDWTGDYKPSPRFPVTIDGDTTLIHYYRRPVHYQVRHSNHYNLHEQAGTGMQTSSHVGYRLLDTNWISAFFRPNPRQVPMPDGTSRFWRIETEPDLSVLQPILECQDLYYTYVKPLQLTSRYRNHVTGEELLEPQVDNTGYDRERYTSPVLPIMREMPNGTQRPWLHETSINATGMFENRHEEATHRYRRPALITIEHVDKETGEILLTEEDNRYYSGDRTEAFCPSPDLVTEEGTAYVSEDDCIVVTVGEEDETIRFEYEQQRTQRTVRVEHRDELTGELVTTLNGQPAVEYPDSVWYDGDQVTASDAPHRTFTAESRPWNPTIREWQHTSRISTSPTWAIPVTNHSPTFPVTINGDTTLVHYYRRPVEYRVQHVNHYNHRELAGTGTTGGDIAGRLLNTGSASFQPRPRQVLMPDGTSRFWRLETSPDLTVLSPILESQDLQYTYVKPLQLTSNYVNHVTGESLLSPQVDNTGYDREAYMSPVLPIMREMPNGTQRPWLHETSVNATGTFNNNNVTATHRYRRPALITIEHVDKETGEILLTEEDNSSYYSGDETEAFCPSPDLVTEEGTAYASEADCIVVNVGEEDVTIRFEYDQQQQRQQRTIRVEHRDEYTGELVTTLNGQPAVEYLEGAWYDGDQVTASDAPVRTFTINANKAGNIIRDWQHNTITNVGNYDWAYETKPAPNFPVTIDGDTTIIRYYRRPVLLTLIHSSHYLPNRTLGGGTSFQTYVGYTRPHPHGGVQDFYSTMPDGTRRAWRSETVPTTPVFEPTDFTYTYVAPTMLTSNYVNHITGEALIEPRVDNTGYEREQYTSPVLQIMREMPNGTQRPWLHETSINATGTYSDVGWNNFQNVIATHRYRKPVLITIEHVTKETGQVILTEESNRYYSGDRTEAFCPSSDLETEEGNEYASADGCKVVTVGEEDVTIRFEYELKNSPMLQIDVEEVEVTTGIDELLVDMRLSHEVEHAQHLGNIRYHVRVTNLATGSVIATPTRTWQDFHEEETLTFSTVGLWVGDRADFDIEVVIVDNPSQNRIETDSDNLRTWGYRATERLLMLDDFEGNTLDYKAPVRTVAKRQGTGMDVDVLYERFTLEKPELDTLFAGRGFTYDVPMTYESEIGNEVEYEVKLTPDSRIVDGDFYERRYNQAIIPMENTEGNLNDALWQVPHVYARSSITGDVVGVEEFTRLARNGQETYHDGGRQILTPIWDTDLGTYGLQLLTTPKGINGFSVFIIDELTLDAFLFGWENEQGPSPTIRQDQVLVTPILAMDRTGTGMLDIWDNGAHPDNWGVFEGGRQVLTPVERQFLGLD